MSMRSQNVSSLILVCITHLMCCECTITVFTVTGMIQRNGPQEWVWTEIKEAADMAFRFVNKTEPSDYCTKLANNMQVYAVEHSISGDALYFECDAALTFEFLKHLTPRN